MKTIKPNNVSNYYDSIEIIVDKETSKRPIWQRVSAGVIAAYAALVFGAGNMTACGDDNPGNPDTIVNPDSGSGQSPLSAVDYNKLLPSSGTSWTSSDSPAPIGGQTPKADLSWSGSVPNTVDVTIDVTGDNATPSDTSDDWNTSFSKNNASLDTTVTEALDLLTANKGSELKDGEKVSVKFIATANVDGKDYSQSGNTSATYKADNKLKVVGCYVSSAHVGDGLTMDCTGKDPAGKSLTDGWKLTSDLTGASIFGIDAVAGLITKGALSDVDVGIHSYSVTCSNGTETSTPYSFSVPVDAHKSTILLKCSDGSSETLLLPETSVDSVAKKCGTGFNASLKPNSNSSPAYVLEVTPTCVEGAINGLSTDEKKAHNNYNQGKTVSDVYKNCSVTSAQASYTSGK